MRPTALGSLLIPAVAGHQDAASTPPRIDAAGPDRDLVRRARGGDRWAEEALYRRHARAVARTVSRLLARSVEAEDVVQDAFIFALTHLEDLRDPDLFGRWVLQVAVRLVHRRFRQRSFLRLLGLDRGADDVTLAAQADPRAGPEIHARIAELDRALTRLPARCRVAWVLRYVEGSGIDEVAAASSCSRATAKRLIARADRELRACVALDEREDSDD
ncbi:MAG TPA: sigma-70 family RNA polymerase sigma factor [Polyangiaceae bacterium]|nr:sigma-70 family RNA polymerase sigma factor [Polyangiaceae bacterium]